MYWPFSNRPWRRRSGREWHAGQGHRGGCAEQGQDVAVDFRIQRHDGRDDLDFILEVFREQRTDRTVDQARGERFLFGLTAFALEEAARDTAAGIEFFLVIDGEREEILARAGVFAATTVASTTVPSIDTMHCAAGLTSDFAGLQGDLMLSYLKSKDAARYRDLIAKLGLRK